MKKIAFLIEDISEKGGRETVLATLANALSDTYDIKSVTPVDMFPHTNHIENVVQIFLKK